MKFMHVVAFNVYILIVCQFHLLLLRRRYCRRFGNKYTNICAIIFPALSLCDSLLLMLLFLFFFCSLRVHFIDFFLIHALFKR